jgi:type I restriction enzyme S subunit
MRLVWDYPNLKIQKKGTLVIAMYGATIGKLGLLDIDATTNQACCCLNLSKSFNSKYYFYLLLSNKQNIISLSVGGTQPNVSQSILAHIKLIAPPFSEQQSIALYLDAKTHAIDKKVSLLEQKVETYKKLKRTLINQTITKGLDKNVPLKDSGISWIGQIPQHWEVKRFKSFADTIKGKNLEVFDNQIEGTLPNLSLEYLRNDSVGFEAFVKTNNRNLIVNENDLIIVWDGAGVGEILNGKVGVISSTIAKLKFNKSLNAKFFSFIRYDLEYRLKQIPTGMGIPHLNPQELKNFMCPIPPKSEQQEIAKYLDQKTTTIDAIVHNIGKQVETLKQLRKTLINDVVTGKIKVVN